MDKAADKGNTEPMSSGDLSSYQIGELMEQTRQLAADFRISTGKTLPVGGEIALYDASRLLGLGEPDTPTAGIDLQSSDSSTRFQVKSRALFSGAKSAPRLGSINPNGNWTHLLLVLMNESYQTTHLYTLELKVALSEANIGGKNAMTVAKFKVIGDCIWSQECVAP